MLIPPEVSSRGEGREIENRKWKHVYLSSLNTYKTAPMPQQFKKSGMRRLQ
jgi:hypothetical protein